MRTLIATSCLLAIALSALAQTPTERIPNRDFENAYPRWASFERPQAYVENGVPANYLEGASVMVDERGVIHLVARERKTSTSGIGETNRIIYVTNRWDTRRANGWSDPESEPIDSVTPGGNEDVCRPDIWIAQDGTIYVVWEYHYNDGGSTNYSTIRMRVKTASGWGSYQTIAYVDSQTRCEQPQISADEDGQVYVCYSTVSQASPTTAAAYLLPIGGSPELFASGFTNSYPSIPTQIYYPGRIRMAHVPGSPGQIWIVWEGEDAFSAGGIWRTLRTGPGSYSGPVKFSGTTGVDFTPDIAVDEMQNTHVVWTRNSNSIRYSYNFGSDIQVNSASGSYTSTRIVLMRNQPFVFYTGPRCGARIFNPDPNNLSPSFYLQEPLAAPLAVKTMGNPWDVAITSSDKIVLCSNNTVAYTLENDLKAFSGAARVDAMCVPCPCHCYNIPGLLGPPDDDGPESPQVGGSGQEGNQINAINGNVSFDLPLFSTNGVAPAQSCSLHYNTQDPAMSNIAPGWRFNYEIFLTDAWTGLDSSTDSITLHVPGERSIHFFWPGAPYNYFFPQDEYGFYAKLVRTTADYSTTEYVLTLKSGEEWTFNNAGKVREIRYLTGNFITLGYTSGRLTSITDQLGNGGGGRTATIDYEPDVNPLKSPRAIQVTDPALNRYALGYTEERLTTVEFTDGTDAPTWGFDYYPFGNPGPDGFRAALKQVRTPEGQVANPQYGTTFRYWPDGRFKGLDDPEDVYLLDSEGDGIIPSSHIAQTTMEYEETGDPAVDTRVTTYTDRRGNQLRIYNEPRRSIVLRIEDAAYLAGTPGIFPTVYEHDQVGFFNRNLLTVTDRWNLTTTYEYAAIPAAPLIPVQDNLFRISRPKMSGAGQDLVAEMLYTSDDHNRMMQLTTFATPPGGGSPVARVTEFGWDPATGQLLTVTYPDVIRPDGVNQNGVMTTYIHAGPRLQLSEIIEAETPALHTFFNAFDPVHGLPVHVTRSGGTQAETFTHDVMGNLASRTIPRGGAGNEVPGPTEFGRDGMYRVTSLKDPKGLSTYFSYDRNSNLTVVDPPAGGNVSTDYDKRDMVMGGTTPDGSWMQWMDANGNVSRVANLRGHTSNYDFDLLDRLSESRVPGGTTLAAGQGGGYNETVGSYTGIHITQHVHDGFDQPTSTHYSTVTRLGSPADRVTRTEFNNRHLPAAEIEPDGLTKWEFFYDEQGRETARQMLYSGAVQTAAVAFRDARNRVDHVRVQDTAFGVSPTKVSHTYTLFNKMNSVVRTADPLATVVEGSPFPRAHTVEYVRDVRERVIQVKDGKDVVVVENDYGDDDLVTETRWPDPATKTTALVTRMTYTYTKRKELKSAHNRNGVGMDYAYGDLPGQLSTATNAGGVVTRTTYYDTTQRIETVYEADGLADESRTTYAWTNGLLTKTTVWNPAAKAYTADYNRFYDKANRLERLESPAVASGTQIAAERYFCNAFEETSKFVAGTKTITHDYNALGQPHTSAWTGAYSTVVTRAWDGAGNLTSVNDGARERVMSYETWLGLPDQETFNVGGAFFKGQNHGYDAASNYRSLTDPEGALHEWEVDENNRVTEIKYQGVPVTEMTYTPGGLLDTTAHWSGGSTPMVIAATEESYDGLGRLSERKTVKGTSGPTLADFVWGYDIRDRRTGIDLVHQSLSFTLGYDDRDQLEREQTAGNGTIPARDITWAYDPAGNRLAQTIDPLGANIVTAYTYNAASQFQQEATPLQNNKIVSYTYDQWGNQKSRTTQAGAKSVCLATENFDYNYLNLLSSYVPDPAPIQIGVGEGPTGWQYDYWPTGERCTKTNLAANPDTREIYVPRFVDVVTEYGQVGAGAITLKNTYVQGTGIDSKSTRIAAGGARRHYLSDAVGTVALLLDDAGAIARQTIRDAWGNQLSTRASAERYGFAQREHDSESGLVYMRARQYDPRNGRFTQRDPVIGNIPREHYLYARSSPAMFRDPMGTNLVDDFWNLVAAAWEYPSFAVTDSMVFLRGWTDGTGAAGPYSALHNGFGETIFQHGPQVAYGFAADCYCGARSEGDVGLLYAAGGFYDPTLPLVLPTGPHVSVSGPYERTTFSKIWNTSKTTLTGIKRIVWSFNKFVWFMETFVAGNGGVLYTTPEPVKGLTTALTKVTIAMEAVNSTRFMVQAVQDPNKANSAALSGEYGTVIQASSMLGHWISGDKDKILPAAEKTILGRLGAWAGEGIFNLGDKWGIW